MTLQDKAGFGKLAATFHMNFRLTELYALYLERCPDFITKEMMDALCEDGSVTRQGGFTALLCELFGLGMDGNIEDKRLIREYIRPSVKMLDTGKYKDNPYYKNIKIENVKDGDWELRQETYPAYRGFISGDMNIYEDFTEFAPLGFFCEDFSFPAVLEDGNEWMTLTPVDLDTCEDAIAAACGKVLTYGLGLGYYAYMVSEKDEVESITVVEKSEKVIKLFEKYILPQFPNKEKVRIINSDAFEYAENTAPGEGYDVIFADIWRDSSDGLELYERFKQLEPRCEGAIFLYWIEGFIRSRKRALKFTEYRDIVNSGKDNSLDFKTIYQELKSI